MLKITALCDEVQGCPLYAKGSKLDFTTTPPTIAGLDGLPVCAVAVTPLQAAAAKIGAGDPPGNHARTFCGGCPAGKAWWSFMPIVKETESTLSPAASQFILNSISRMRIFGGVHVTKLMRIVKLIKGTRVPSGRAIVQRGHPGEAFFIVLEGNTEVIQEDENGRESVLVTLPPGECFGEMSLITGEPATATVRAKDDATVLVMSKENFYAMLGIAPEVAITLARILAGRLTHTSRRVLEELKKGMKGRLDLISPAELIQAMNVNSQTGMLLVESADQSLTIYLHDGQIHEVKMGEKSGEEAFFEFLSWAKGQFQFEPVRKDQSLKQVQMDTVGLLLEGMRRVDEYKQTGVWKKN
ncbi:MAG TPA: cyclic nucleotide-binding domain-containing protein [Planctomycetota bacterium]|nr:cyclic nucleotide-binding domain-containing protein [Planctomycetota bacterium]